MDDADEFAKDTVLDVVARTFVSISDEHATKASGGECLHFAVFQASVSRVAEHLEVRDVTKCAMHGYVRNATGTVGGGGRGHPFPQVDRNANGEASIT
jgi:hypothetical protein